MLSRFNRVRLFATPWSVALRDALSIGFSRQEYWNGLSFAPPGNLLNPGIKSESLLSPALAGGFFTTGVTWKDLFFIPLICLSVHECQVV